MEGLGNLERINAGGRKLVEAFSNKIINIYGNQLKSIIAYGSVLGDSFNPKRSDINLLLILDDTGLTNLKKCQRYSRNINPLLLTKAYIQSSRDVYPIEFLEMKENYATIYGEDVLQDMVVDRQYLRLECEQQLKGGILKLKQGYLRSKGKVSGLLKDSIGTIIIIFRNLIRIKGEEPPLDKERVIEKTADYYNIDKEVFHTVLRFKMGHEKVSEKGMEVYFGRYLKELEHLVGLVDKL